MIDAQHFASKHLRAVFYRRWFTTIRECGMGLGYKSPTSSKYRFVDNQTIFPLGIEHYARLGRKLVYWMRYMDAAHNEKSLLK
jgi:hypothetical protein